MDDGKEEPGAEGPGNLISIVDELERRKRQARRAQVAAMRLRHLDQIFASADLTEGVKAMTEEQFEAGLAQFAELPADEARLKSADLKSVHALRRCLLGDAEGGLAEWAALLAEVPECVCAHLLRARWLVSTDTAAALRDFDQAIALDPRNAGAYLNRGQCFLALGDPDRALANLRRAVALQPDSADILMALGAALAGQGAHAEAVRLFDRAIHTAPGYVDFHLRRAESLVALERFDAAAKDYNRAVELDPKRQDARCLRASCIDKAGSVEATLAEMARLCVSDPNQEVNHRMLGEFMLRAGKAAEAMPELDRAIALEPTWQALWLRAMGHLIVDADELARDDLTRAIDLMPTRAHLYLDWARAHARLGAVEAAHADTDKALELEPESPIAHVMRGYYRDCLEWDQAVVEADYDRGVALDPENPDLLRDRGAYRGRHGRFAEAMRDLDRALELDPGLADAYFERGTVNARINDEKRDDEEEPLEIWWARSRAAVADFEKALELGYRQDEALYLDLHDCSVQVREDGDDAMDILDRGIEAVPESAQLHVARWILFRARGDEARAAADKARAIELGFDESDFAEEAPAAAPPEGSSEDPGPS